MKLTLDQSMQLQAAVRQAIEVVGLDTVHLFKYLTQQGAKTGSTEEIVTSNKDPALLSAETQLVCLMVKYSIPLGTSYLAAASMLNAAVQAAPTVPVLADALMLKTLFDWLSQNGCLFDETTGNVTITTRTEVPSFAAPIISFPIEAQDIEDAVRA